MALGAGVGTVLAGVADAQSRKDQNAMTRRAIPSTGERLPVIGCGTWQTFDVGTDVAARARLADVTTTLFSSSGSVIDSSPMYGTSEEVTGAVLASTHARTKAFLATKVWTRGREAGRQQIERSMHLLGVDTLDLLQVHNLLDWRTQLATLRDLKSAGRIRYVGVTHYTSGAYPELETVMRNETLDFVQVNYSADDRAAEDRILPLAADRGMAVLINLPFGGGGLLRRLSARPLPKWAADADCRSWAQVLLKFALAHPAVTCVIPGTSSPAHMAENAQAGSGLALTDDLKRRLVAEIAG